MVQSRWILGLLLLFVDVSTAVEDETPPVQRHCELFDMAQGLSAVRDAECFKVHLNRVTMTPEVKRASCHTTCDHKQGVEELATTLAQNMVLYELRFSHCGLGDAGFAKVLKALAARPSPLTTLAVVNDTVSTTFNATLMVHSSLTQRWRD